MRNFFTLLLLIMVNINSANEQQSFYNANNPIPMELLDSWDSIEEIVVSFKRYGLFYCIHAFDKTQDTDVIAKTMRYYKLKLLHQDGDEIRQKRLEKYIATMIDSKDFSHLAYDNGTKFYTLACINLYESKTYMQEIDRILRPYYLDSVFPKEYQERYKKTIQRFLDMNF